MQTWIGTGNGVYKTQGGRVVDRDGRWYAIVGRRVRGPLSWRDAAMDAVIEMIKESDVAAKSNRPGMDERAG